MDSPLLEMAYPTLNKNEQCGLTNIRQSASPRLCDFLDQSITRQNSRLLA